MSTDPFDLLFRQGRMTRFDASHDPSLTPQEGLIGYGQISPYGFLEPGSVDNAQLVDGAITSTKITDGSISTPKLAANAVTADKIAAHSISAGDFMGNPGNESPNPSFEFIGSTTVLNAYGGIGNMPGWQPLNNSGQQQITNTTARGGSLCWLSKQPSPVANVDLQSEAVSVIPGRRYRYSVWFRGVGGNSAGAAGSLFIRYLDASGTSLGFISPDAGGSTTVTVGASATFVQASGYFVIPSTAAFIQLGVTNNAAGSVGDFVYADTVELYPADYDVKHGGGNVIIDSTGITINNGKLTFQDQFGTNSMSGAGFDGAWVRYLMNRVYNGAFLVGSGSDIPVSEVGTGSTVADYNASLSPLLPYWVVSASGGTLTIEADSAASGGFALKSACTAGGQTNRIYQDIPIIPGEVPHFVAPLRVTRTANDVAVNFYASYRKADHSIIGSRLGYGLAYNATVASYFEDPGIVPDGPNLGLAAAPSNAFFVRVEIEVVHNTGTGTTVWFSDAKYRSVKPSSFQLAADVPLTLTTAFQDISSLTWTSTDPKPTSYLVIFTVDFTITTAGVGYCVARLLVDGIAYGSQAIFRVDATAINRGTVSQTAIVTTQVGGSGIIKVQAEKTTNAGAATAGAGHSTLTVIPL